MRLINTTTLQFQEFFDNEIPEYAILSHRWGPEHEEVSFQDFESQRKRGSPGHQKILKTCELAKRQSLDWAWIDTCCIDKKSSAESSEAINSMYRWYQKSTICYAYLSDVHESQDEVRDNHMSYHATAGGCFLESAWFTRGWTLQELLAPVELVFLNSKWRRIGRKSQLSALVSRITGIEEVFLLRNSSVEWASVAQKMSWASRRTTSRTEDMAYCLLGLFDINMPPLYGEGEKAFRRLQLEIIKETNDESIFVWADSRQNTRKFKGILAKSPKVFAGSEHISRKIYRTRPPYAATNLGLEFPVPTNFITSGEGALKSGTILVPLNCQRTGSAGPVAIGLTCLDIDYSGFYSAARVAAQTESGVTFGLDNGLTTRNEGWTKLYILV